MYKITIYTGKSNSSAYEYKSNFECITDCTNYLFRGLFPNNEYPENQYAYLYFGVGITTQKLDGRSKEANRLDYFSWGKVRQLLDLGI